jgi:uncharacterized protein RhaS with RHS repeats
VIETASNVESRFARWLNADPNGLAGGLNLYAYVGNSPIGLIDPLGLAVYVGEHGAMFSADPLQHRAIVLRPDNPGDFSTDDYNRLFRGTDQATLGGQPAKVDGKLTLVSYPNYPGDNPGSECHPGKLKHLVLVPTPPGMTDTQFIEALIAASQSYQNSLPYRLFPTHDSDAYNSNGYVAGVIEAAGGTPPVMPGVAPGYRHPIPLR